MSGKTFDENTLKELIEEHQKTLSQVSVKAVGSQVALMSAISLATLLAFSFFRPRQKKVYAPKVKYADVGPKHDPNSFNSVVPPPSIPNGFFSWFSPVLHVKEQQMSDQIGLDGVAFLRFLRLVRWIFVAASVLAGGVLLPINIVYNLRNVPSTNRNVLSLLTIQNLGGNIVFVHVAITYLITLAVMYLVWYHWQKMLLLRQAWFRGSAYQSRIYSRTLMITQIRKDYRTDEGLIALMSLLKVDGIKMNSMIDCSSIGRQLEDFPDLVESHNAAVRDLEASLVKYLKHDKMGTKRPTMTKGGFLGIGGEKKDAIEYHAKEIKFLKEKIENKRGDIEQLIRRDRNARKQHKKNIKPHGENYGFVSMKTIADAHRIARTHRGRLKELFGAEIQLAPSPQDIVWKNVKLEPGQRKSNEWFGFAILGLVCALNTIPVLVVSLLANLSALAVYVNFLYKWKDAGQWGNWTFSIVSGVLPSVVSAAFGYLLPIIMRRLSKYQGAMTRSRLDRAVCQRYFAFMVVSNLFIFSLISVVYAAIAEIVLRIGKHQSFSDIMKGFSDIPDQIQGTYVQQSTYWLTYLPLRGFLFFFELAQIIKLALLSVRRLLFARTPRDIREWTTPPYFEYAIVSVNLLFIATVGLVYAPLAPLVCIGATCVFWISSVVYKYQLLYVYVSRAESGGRMWNVYVNRLLAAVVLMQLLMVLTTGLARQRWLDAVAAVPPVLMIAGFKLYMSRTAEYGFRYFTPSPVEEAEFVSRQEKRTHHKEMETRFLHPALQRSQLFTIMVHKSQEALAREVLSEYPWFRDSEVEIKAIREENLEFDPKAASDLAETRSIASTDMLATGSAVTPPPFYSTDGINSTASISKSGMAERSTDNLLRERSGSVEGFGSGPVYPIVQRRHRGETDSISGAPLLDYAQPPWASHSYAGSAVEVDQEQSYPPTAFARPVMPRADSAMSHQSDRSGWSGSGQDVTQGYQQAYGYQQPRYQ